MREALDAAEAAAAAATAAGRPAEEEAPGARAHRFRLAVLKGFGLVSVLSGRPRTPPDHWNRNLIQQPPSQAEFLPDFKHIFTDGKPWFFKQHPLRQ